MAGAPKTRIGFRKQTIVGRRLVAKLDCGSASPHAIDGTAAQPLTGKFSYVFASFPKTLRARSETVKDFLRRCSCGRAQRPTWPRFATKPPRRRRSRRHRGIRMSRRDGCEGPSPSRRQGIVHVPPPRRRSTPPGCLPGRTPRGRTVGAYVSRLLSRRVRCVASILKLPCTVASIASVS